MATRKLSEMSNEALLKGEKSLKVITYVLAGMLLVIFALNMILSIKKGFSAINVVPIALLPIVIVNLGTLKKMKEELKSRAL